MTILSSLLYTIIVGGFFVYVFIFMYDLFYGENPKKQVKKIQKYFKRKEIGQINLLEHKPKKYSLYQIELNHNIEKIKMKPGYKVVRIVPKKNA